MSLNNFFDPTIFTLTEERPSGWLHGHLNSKPDHEVRVLAFTDGSNFGINNGRISKLEVSDATDKTVIRYDRGWDLKPQTSEYRNVVKQLEQAFRPLSPDYKVVHYHAPDSWQGRLQKLGENLQETIRRGRSRGELPDKEIKGLSAGRDLGNER